MNKYVLSAAMSALMSMSTYAAVSPPGTDSYVGSSSANLFDTSQTETTNLETDSSVRLISVDSSQFTASYSSAVITAVMTDTLQNDVNTTGQINPGDTLRYSATLSVASANATGIQFDIPVSALNTLVVGSVTTSQGSVVSGNAGGDSTVSVNVGDVNVGGTVTITFDVLVGAPTTDPATISKQGSVSGSNFATVVTDDPDTGLVSDATTVSFDGVAPRVYGIFRQSQNPTKSDQVTWTVNFNQTVVNVDTTDFVMSGTTATVTEITSVSSQSYLVRASGGNLASLMGTVTLGFAAGQDISDANGNPLSNLVVLGTNDNTYTLDNTGPEVTRVDVPPNGSYTAGQNLDFTVNYDEAVNVIGTPSLRVTIGSTWVIPIYQPALGSSTALVFRYTVATGDLDTDGVALTSTAISTNAGVLRDAAGNEASLILNNVSNATGVLVDAVAPLVSEVTPVASPGNDSTPDVVIFTNSDGTVAVSGSCGSLNEGAVSAGNNSITLTQSDNSSALADGTYANCSVIVTDAVGNSSTPLALTGFNVDTVAPIVSEVTAVVTPANDSMPDVTFSTSESGNLAVGGSCGSADEGAVSGGNHTITLTLPDNSSALTSGTYSNCTVTVTDAAGNSSTALTLSSFEVDTVLPLAQSFTRKTPVAENTSADSLTWLVTFSKDVTGVEASDFAISASTASLVVSQLTAATYEVTVSGGDLADFNGVISLNLNSPTIVDALGNALSVSEPAVDQTYRVTNAFAPEITEGVSVTVNMDEDGSPAAFALTLNATDANNDTLTWSVQTQATKGSASVSGTGNSKAINYLPNANENGNDSFVVRVSDGSFTDDITVNVTIAAVNDAATISLSGDAAVGQQLTAAITDTDGLPDSGITYQWSAGGVNIQSATASNYTPQAADIGKTLMVSASFTDADGSAESVSSAATSVVISAADYSQQGALATISKTANKAVEPAPSVQNYQDAGVKHADAETLQRILPILNRAVAHQAAAEDVNELSEIQALLDVVLLGQDIDADGLPGIVEGGADKDSDNDGSADMRDSDADNDGIADVLELSLEKTDTDNDGIIDWFDADTDNDGTLNNSETRDANYDGVNDARDSLTEIIAASNALDVDLDGQINSLDLDADNDGVFDVIEAGLTDKDENALLDQGVKVITDAGLLADTNVDGTANFLQLKSDGQQRDFISADLPASLDADNDGRLDSQADLDNDGLMDVVDNAIGAFGSYRDMDNDGIPNHLDEDDDNDGFSDIEENNNSDVLSGKDADADGIDDGIDHSVNGTITGQDSNNNGIQDSLELPDTDGDGIADYLDNDSDNDGVTDNIDPSVSIETDIETGGALTVFGLMLLFALMIAARQKKRLLILSALAFSTVGHSDEIPENHWDVSFTTGLSYLTPKLFNDLKLTDKTGLSMTAEVGYQFANDLRAKARYVDLGNAEINSAELNYKAYVAAVEYQYDINEKYQGYAAVGYGRLETSSGAGLNLDNSNPDHPYFNAGLRYHVIPTLSVVLDMNSYSPDAQEISFGFVGRF